MIYVLFGIFVIVFCIALFEERLMAQRIPMYLLAGAVLVLCAGLKEVGFDNDSKNYEYFYSHYDDMYVQMAAEYSFLALSKFLNRLTGDVHIMFFLYGGVGVVLKMLAIKRLSEYWFLPLLVYWGNYYLLHDLTQIRACVVSGLLLLAVKPLAEGRKKLVALIILFCCVFHYSSIVLFFVLLFNNKELSPRWRMVWAAVVPVGYVFALAHINLLASLPIPYIGEKIEAYQELSEKGIAGGDINVFNAVFLVTWMTYLYCLYFYDTIKAHNRYLPLMLRMTGVSIFSFLVLSFLPVLSFRVSELYGIVEIFLFANIYYTIRPKWLGVSVVGVVGLSLFCINAFYAEFLHP